MSLRLTAAPVAEPITLAELKAHLNVAGTADDTLLTTIIVAARATVERLAHRTLLSQNWRLTLDAVPDGGIVPLPLSPLQAVTAVRVADAAGVWTTLPATAYLTDLAGDGPRLLFTGAPPVPGRPIGGLEIDLTAGYGELPADVPPPLVQAVRMLAAHWYRERGNSPAPKVPDDVVALTAEFRVRRLVA